MRTAFALVGLSTCRAVHKSNCFHEKGHEADCSVSDSMYMVAFGIVQIFLSQLPNFHELWWLSIVAAVMSIAYSTIAVGLSLAKTISGAPFDQNIYHWLEVFLFITYNLGTHS